MKIHRLVLMVFNPNPNYKYLEVDHLDNNPLNNYIGNLEWVTKSENLRRKHQRLLDKGMNEYSYNSSNKLRKQLTEDQVRNICELFEQGYSANKAYDELQYTDFARTTFKNIKLRRYWTNITKDYIW